jgi:hypothetical protein
VFTKNNRKRKLAKRQKQLRRRKPPRRRSRKPERNRPTLKERYAPLIEWVAFVNGTEDSIPSEPLPEQSVIFRENIRGWARELLRKLAAEKVKRNDIFDFVRSLPAPQFMIAGRALTDRDIDRVRICPVCDKLFVALNDRARTCGAGCSNIRAAKNFYRNNREAERKRKREEYKKAKLEREMTKGFIGSSSLRSSL